MGCGGVGCVGVGGCSGVECGMEWDGVGAGGDGGVG